MRQISDAELDRALLSCAADRFQKVAMVAAKASDMVGCGPDEAAFGRAVDRIQLLAQAGSLQAAGDLTRPRDSEVRLPAYEVRT